MNEEDFFNFDLNLEETPTCRVIMFHGGRGTGKTVTTASLCKRTIFISSDGNAKKQGFRAIDFELLPNVNNWSPAERMWRSMARILNYLLKNRDKFDAIAFDLIEYYDNTMQSLYTGIENSSIGRLNIQDWGEIKSFYDNLNYYLNQYFDDKVIFFLSRQVEEETTDKSFKKQTKLTSALRKKLSNILDASVSLSLTIDKDHTLEFEDSYRFKGTPINPLEADVLNKIKKIMIEQGTLDETEQ